MYVTQKLTYKRYNKTKITTIREENEHLACLDISLYYCQRWQTFRVFFQLNQMKAKIMVSAPQLWKNTKRNNLFYLLIKGIYWEKKLNIYRNHISKRFEDFIMIIKHSQMWFPSNRGPCCYYISLKVVRVWGGTLHDIFKSSDPIL